MLLLLLSLSFNYCTCFICVFYRNLLFSYSATQPQVWNKTHCHCQWLVETSCLIGWSVSYHHCWNCTASVHLFCTRYVDSFCWTLGITSNRQFHIFLLWYFWMKREARSGYNVYVDKATGETTDRVRYSDRPACIDLLPASTAYTGACCW